MKLKNAISALLLLFVFGSVAYMVANDFGQVGDETPAPKGAEPEVVVYFFDGGKDCATCDKLEAYAYEALKTHFSEELASGVLEWRRLDTDEPANEHYVTDFSLYTKSVVVFALEDGEQIRWKNLEDIWELVYDKPAYLEYIRANTRDFLGVAP